VVTLNLPPSVYDVLKYFLAIPFFILLLLFTNVAFDAFSEIARFESERKRRRQIRESTKRNADAFDGPESARFASDDPLAPILVEDGVSRMDSLSGEGSLSSKEESMSLNHAIEEGLRVVKYVVFLLIVIVGFQTNDVQIVNFFESATVFTLSVVFAAQPWIRNLIGGLLVFFDDKFKVNEYVRVVGVEGCVRSITLRTTVMERPDKSLVYIPNSRVLDQPVANFSRRKTRLLEVRMRLSPKTSGSDIRKLIAELEHTMQTLHPSLTSHASNPYHNRQNELGAPEFFVVLDQMFEILVWTHTSGFVREAKSHSEIQSEIMLAVTEIMERLGIESASTYESRRGCMRPPERSKPTDLVKEHGTGQAFIQDEYSNDDNDLSMTAYQLLATRGKLD